MQVIGGIMQNKFSENELISKAKKGDADAVTALLNKYKDRVSAAAKTLFLMGGDKDDLIQEGMIGLFSAITTFSEDAGASFSTFADLCIKRQMYKAIESGNTQKNIPLNEYVSFYTPVSSDDEDKDLRLIDTMKARGDANPEERLIDEENAKDFEKTLLSMLSPKEKQVFELYIGGYGNNAAMAERLGVTEKSVDNALVRIKTKARKCLENKEV